MVLRTAALYGRDPRDLETSAEVLALRGVHPTVEAARAALEQVRDTPAPGKPVRRRSLRTWVRSLYVLLIFGGFVSAPSDVREEASHPWLKACVGFVVGVAVWVTTWVLPVTFMVAMAWGCETHARQLGRRALLFYDGDADSAQAAIAAAKQRRDRGHAKREVFRADDSRPVDRDSDRFRGLRRSRSPEHRRQLARRARRARRALTGPSSLRPFPPSIATIRAHVRPSRPRPSALTD